MTRYQRLEAPQSGRQHAQHIADIDDDLSVAVARWPQRPGHHDLPKPPQVMWRDNNTFRYATPEAARRFAAALVQAADEVEREGKAE